MKEIEARLILPTPLQGLACIRVCQMLSNGYREIGLFRYSEETGEVYILAGKDIEVLVFQDGTWEFA